MGGARPGIFAPALIIVTQVGKQPHQQGLVDRVGVGGVCALPQGHDGVGYVRISHAGRVGAGN